jgi:hypothetical protein
MSTDDGPVIRYSGGWIAADLTHQAELIARAPGRTYELAAPVRDGVQLTFINNTNVAQTVVAPGLLDSGPGESKDRLTMSPQQGARTVLRSADSRWRLVAGEAEFTTEEENITT